MQRHLFCCESARLSVQSPLVQAFLLIATGVRSVERQSGPAGSKASPLFSSCTVLALRQVIWRGCFRGSSVQPVAAISTCSVALISAAFVLLC